MKPFSAKTPIFRLPAPLCTFTLLFAWGFAFTSNAQETASAEDSAKKSAAAVKQHTSTLAIQETVRSYLQSTVIPELQASYPNGKFSLEVNRLDSRLKLARCEVPLEVEERLNRKPVGRQTVKVLCRGQKPWSIFVGATVHATAPIVVAREAVPRGNLITAANLMLAERDIGSNRRAAYTDTEAIVGKITRTALSPGQVIRANQLREPQLIQKGNRVAIVASSNGLEVRMVGIALSDGRLGDQIRVRNSSSQRVIQARVAAADRVEVIM